MKDMHLTLFVSVIIVALLSDIYIWLSYLRTAAPVCQVLHFLPTAVIVLLLVVMSGSGAGTRFFQGMFFLLLCFVLPKLLFVLCSLSGRGLGLLGIHASGVPDVLGLCLAVIVAAGSCYGLIYGWKRIVVRPQAIVCETLPEGVNLKIVQLSDLHLGTFAGNPEFIDRLVDKVNLEHPDLIVFTGDIVNRGSEELEPFMSILSRLRARYGVMSVLGNHDYAVYGELRDDAQAREADVARLVEMQRQMGWTVLLNGHVMIEHSGTEIAIVGVENEGDAGGVRRARLQDAMANIPPDTFTLLLTHNPQHWREEVVPSTDIPLTLSGHTHAGHFRIGGFSLARWMSGAEWGGLYSEGGQQLFVSAGLGGILPFRFGAWPEINSILLSGGQARPDIARSR